VAGAVPLVLSRVQAAERSSDSAKLVQRAVRITELVQELQQERLASLGYLSNDVARDEVVARSTRVLELARQIDANYGSADDKLALALRQVTLRSALDGLRPQILEQRTAGFGVYTGFTGAIDGLVDQLRLTGDADLRTNAGPRLDTLFRPIVQGQLDKVGTTRSFNAMMGRASSLPLGGKVAFALNAYVTGKALDGLFLMIGREEEKIRKDPVARTTDLLKIVFGGATPKKTPWWKKVVSGSSNR